jgi:hypothetical protein
MLNVSLTELLGNQQVKKNTFLSVCNIYLIRISAAAIQPKLTGEQFLRLLSFDNELRTSLLWDSSDGPKPDTVANFFAKATGLEQVSML